MLFGLYKNIQIEKREPTAVDSFGLPHPPYPTYAEKPTPKRERFALFSEYGFLVVVI